MFGSQISQKPLAIVSRSLSTLLHSGVDVRKSFRLAGAKVSDHRCREAMERIAEQLSKGDAIAAAMRDQGRRFPGLFIDMVEMAEQSGALPEVLEHLADHYDKAIQLRRQFIRSISWPAFQLFAAILVIGVLILILGIIADARGGEALDVLGFGLYGASGAMVWFACSFGSVGALIAAYFVGAHALGVKRQLDTVLMRIPVVGNCMRSFAIARFSWALYLTQQTGMPITQSVAISLKATGNGAFVGVIPQTVQMIKDGSDLSDALAATRLLPDDFLHMVQVAETSGTVPEQLNHLSPQFRDQAERSMRALTSAAGWLVWLLVAVFVIFLIFRVVFWYLGMLNDAIQLT